jgi:transcriptional regulator with XRE-family HTH domain
MELLKLYNMSDVAMTIKMVARLKGISVTELLARCELGKNYLVNMAGGTSPSLESIAKIADVLDVSVDYLLGRTNIPEVNK